MSDHLHVFCCEDKMTEGVVHEKRYNMGIRTYALHALHTIHDPPFPCALHTVHITALNLGRPLFPLRGIKGLLVCLFRQITSRGG
jgi:hypothetical protein